MTTLILAGGIAIVVAIAWAMRRQEWRLPALLFAILAVPGNVDNLLPQMRLDPHDIANATAPAVSFVDLLLAWGVAVTAREGGFRGWPKLLRTILAGGCVVAAAAAVVSLVNVAQGADPSAAARGILAFARIPAALAITFAVREQIRDGRLLAVAGAAGAVSLVANGLYTSASLDATRFTAATFGRNGFSLVLVVTALLATGLAVELRRRGSRALWWAAAFAIAGIALFSAIATGSRMSLLVGVPVAAAAMIVNRSWWNRRGVVGAVALAVAAVLVAGSAMLWTSEGARALSALLNPGETVDIITDPESEPDYSPVRTRTRWWSHAVRMIADDPATGVGAYQWAIERYRYEPEAEPVVADTHNTYLQMGAEYGLPVLLLYVALLGSVAIAVGWYAWSSRSVVRSSAPAVAVLAAAVMIPMTEVTNSYLFNVRIGIAAWILLATAVLLTVVPARQRGRAEPAPTARRTGAVEAIERT